MDEETHVGEQVRRLRSERGLSVRGLARRAELAPGTVHLVETGQREPNAVTVTKLAKALSVDPGALFETPLAGAR